MLRQIVETAIARTNRVDDLRHPDRRWGVEDLLETLEGELLNIDPHAFSGHSPRAGFCTSAAEHGASLFKIMDVTRHKGRCAARVCAAGRQLQGPRRGGVPLMRPEQITMLSNREQQPRSRHDTRWNYRATCQRHARRRTYIATWLAIGANFITLAQQILRRLP